MDEKTQVDQVETDTLNIRIKRSPGCQVELDVKVTPSGAKAAHKKAIKKINKEVSLPGFRKGKAPTDLIIQRYGKNVDSEWREVLVQDTFAASVIASTLYPLTKQAIQKPKLVSISLDEGAHVTFAFESYPVVPLIDPSSISLTEEPLEEPTEEEVNYEIEELLLSQAEWTEITDRGVEEGDMVSIDIENLDNPGELLCEDTCLKAIEGEMGSWLLELIKGKSPGDEVEGVSESEKADFTPTRCKVTIRTIKQAEIPELTDKFASTLGADSVADFTQKAKERVAKKKADDRMYSYFDQLKEILSDEFTFDIPLSITRQEMAANLRRKNLPASLPKEERARIESKVEQEAMRAIREGFLLDKFAEEHNVDVSKREHLQAMLTTLYRNPEHKEDVEALQKSVYRRLLSDKVRRLIVEKALPKPVA